ncbi:MAG: glycosyltransferase [Oscillospiraceae bacterium]|nr:glycosyltransferase [Oscillospiraceae bacterium]
MKIALFTETYFPSVNGVAAHVKTLKNGLEKLGNEVLIVTADKHCKHHYIDDDNILHCPSTEVKRLYGFGAAPPFSYKRMRLITKFDPDVIHIHQEFGIGLSGILAAKKLKIPLVYTLHTVYDQYIYYIAPPPFIRAATKMSHHYERFIASHASELTGPSQKCEEYFKKIGVRKDVNLIPNAIDLEMFDPARVKQSDKAEFLNKYGIPIGKLLVCFVGRLGKEKSVDVLLEYWAETITRNDDMHLVIIGDGPDKRSLELLAENLNIKDMVTFTGMIKHDAMPVCFAACDVYATASLSEMNSISMLEGMASGLPVLQRYDEMNASQIEVGVNGYLFHTAQEMAGRLRDLKALSPEKRAGFEERVIGSVVSRGVNELAEYMLGVYKKALSEKPDIGVKRRLRL